MSITPTSMFSSGLWGLNQSQAMFAQSAERLATGLMINRGADNPAGLIASEYLSGRLASIDSEIRAIDRTNMTLAIEDGYMSAASAATTDLQGLIVQGANAGGLSSEEVSAIQSSINGAVQGMEFILGQAGSDVLSDVSVQREIGTDPDTGDPIYETLTMSDLAGLVESDPESAQALVDAARDAVVGRQAEIGAEQRANESLQRAMQEEQINIARARSAIRDTDYAMEASNSMRASILGEASIRVMLIGREQGLRVLDLLA